MNKISVIIKEPGRDPRHVNISHTLANLQKIVGGYIEAVTIASDLVVICDEEGRLKGYDHCCWVCGVEFVGPVIFVGFSGEDLTSIPLTFGEFRKAFPELWERR